MMQNMADGTDLSRFIVYTRGLTVACESCGLGLLTTHTDQLLVDLTDAARTHVCDPVRKAKVDNYLAAVESDGTV